MLLYKAGTRYNVIKEDKVIPPRTTIAIAYLLSEPAPLPTAVQ